MTDYDELRKLAENATPGPWRTDDHLGGQQRNLVAPNGEYIASDFEDYRGVIHRTEDADYIASVHPGMILNLIEDLRITRAERDAEKHKHLVTKQELHLHKTQMREARAIAWDTGAQAGLDWDKNYPGNIRDTNPFKENK